MFEDLTNNRTREKESGGARLPWIINYKIRTPVKERNQVGI